MTKRTKEPPRIKPIVEEELTNEETYLPNRGSTHGIFKDRAAVAQSVMGAIYYGTHWDEVEDDQRQALFMIAEKISRIVTGDPDFTDHWVDIAGYAQLVVDRLKGEAR